MEIFHKEIPKELLESLPEGMKLIRKNNENFLVVEKVFCPNGHSLIDASVQIHGMPTIKIKINDGDSQGYLFVDAFWGSHSKLYSFIPKHSESLKDLDIECPVCGTSLIIEKKCDQDNCNSKRAVQLLMPGKNLIIACARLGCPGHRIEISEVPAKIAQAISSINYYIENFDNNDFFMGI